MPLIDLFIAKAGGPTKRFVIIPTALGGRVDPQREFMAQLLRSKGVEHVTVLQQRRRAQVESAEFRDAIKQASAIWFGGGRQWRLVDAFAGTSALKLFHELLARGGVIAGSSAGATIQGGYLVRGHPLGNTVQMAEGYERGLGFIPHVAIDQHFGQRDRYKDMSGWAKAFPQLLGFGIDEGTALVVVDSVATVHGQFHVAVYNGDDPKPAGADYTELASGDRFDLRTRRRLDK